MRRSSSASAPRMPAWRRWQRRGRRPAWRAHAAAIRELRLWAPGRLHPLHQRWSVTSGTVMADTKLPLTHWFRAMHLMTSTKQGISAIELGRRLGVSTDRVVSA